jgi:hypothetical protein
MHIPKCTRNNPQTRAPRKPTSFQQKTAQARRETRKFKARAQQFSQKGKSQTKQMSHKPTKKLSLPPLAQKQQTAKAKKIIAQPQQSQTKKLNARTQQEISTVATAQTKNDAQKPKRKLLKAELQQKLSKKTQRQLMGLRFLFGPSSESQTHKPNSTQTMSPLPQQKQKKAQATPMAN